MATINHKTYNEATETFKDFSVYDGKETLIFKVDGSEGNVGIGTSSPAGKLDITGGNGDQLLLNNAGERFTQISFTNNSNLRAAVWADETNNDFVLYAASGRETAIYANAAERVRITTTGNVGIGTSAPNTKLDVNGTINVRTNGYEFGRITTNNVSGVDGGLTFQYITGGVFTNGLLLDAAGNVGIGTTAPAYRFNVVTDAIAGAQNLAAIDRTAQNFVTFTNPQFSTDASMGLMLRVFPQSDARQGAGILASGGAANGETDLNLFVSSGSVSSTSYSALTLKGGSGNVGIGTSAPTAKLDVNQTNQSGDNDFIRLTTDATSGSLSLGIYPSSNNSLSFIGSNALFSSGGVTRLNAAAGGSLLSMNTDSIVVYVSSGAANPVERMRIDSSGNVGINTSAPTQKLTVNGNAAVGGQQAFWLRDDDGFSANAARRAWAMTANYNAFGTFSIYGASAVDSDPLAGTAFLNITSAGNVGIGNSSPTATLDVTGTLAVSGNLTSTGSASFTGSVASAISAGEQAILQGGYLQFYNAAATNKFIKLTDDASTIDGIGFSKSGSASTIWFPSGNVGIGTSSPQQKLHVADIANDSYGLITTATNWADNTFTGVKIGSTGDTYGAGVDLRSYSDYSASAKTELALWVNNTSNTMVEVVRATENGLTFNGDTAAANALDDYEEGTFTPTTAGDATGAFSGVLGEYTKIGNVVHFRIAATISTNFTSSDIGGLPFTIGGGGSPSGIVGLFSVANSSSGTLVARLDAATTTIKTYSDNNVNNPIAPSTAMLTLRVFGTYRV
jgi:hypothetical protein